VDLDDDLNSFRWIKAIIERQSDVKVVLLTTFYDKQYITIANKIGALGVIVKENLSPSLLMEIIGNRQPGS